MNNLRYYRKKAGMTQEDLEKSSGVDRSTICLIERGKRNPTKKTMELLSKALGKSEHTIFYRRIVATGNIDIADGNVDRH